ncbi:MAG: branched-chain amino acid ABC transporter permease [Stellaceae bacterium]
MSTTPVPPLLQAAPSPATLPDAVRHLMRRHRPRLYEALPWLLAIAAYFVFPDYLQLGAQVFIAVLFALATDLILGYGGVITLGQAAFFGTGAYVCGILSAHGWTEPLSLLVIAGLAAALVGLVSGIVVLRTTGLTQLMLTLIVAVMLQAAANQATSVTGGANGLQGMVIAPVLGIFDFGLYGVTAYFYCLSVLFLGWLLVRTLVHSPFGRSLTGIRESEARMHAIGSPVFRRRLTAYCISAALCGVAGALLAETTQLVAPDSLSFDRSGTVLIMLIIGGVGRLYGAFIGVPLYMIAQDRFAEQDPVYWYFWIGLFLLLIVLFARGGIIGLGERLWRRRRR